MTALLDDASLLGAPPSESVAGTGALLVPEQFVGRGLGALLDTAQPRIVDLVLTGGAGAMRPALEWLVAELERRGVALRAVHVRLRDGDDLAHNARRITAATDDLRATGHLDHGVDGETVVRVSPPAPAPGAVGPRWADALDELAMGGVELGWWLRDPADHTLLPPEQVAVLLGAALDRELSLAAPSGPLDATGSPGAHDPRYGFLGVLLATRTSLDGGTAPEVGQALVADDVVRRLADLDGPALAAARRWGGPSGTTDPARSIRSLDRTGLRERLEG